MSSSAALLGPTFRATISASSRSHAVIATRPLMFLRSRSAPAANGSVNVSVSSTFGSVWNGTAQLAEPATANAPNTSARGWRPKPRPDAFP